MFFIEDTFYHMCFVLFLTAVAVVLFAREKIPLEVTSIGLLTVLLLFGQVFPIADATGNNQLDAAKLLAGFANPSLIAVLALLVMGQGIIQTDALRPLSQMFMTSSKIMAWISIMGILLFVMVVSAFLNNTPLVILAIPVVQALATTSGMSESRVMIPLSFAAILGGMTTLIGSSTNLLVSSSMTELGYEPIGFFDFTVPGAMMAGVGFIYVIFIAPYMLKDRSSMTQDLVGDKKEFVAEMDISEDSPLIGEECIKGQFARLPDMNIKLIQRKGHLILPPFEGYKIEKHDVLIVSTTRDQLSVVLSKYPGFLLSQDEAEVIERVNQRLADEETSNEDKIDKQMTRLVAEVMIPPASRLIDMTLEQGNFHRQFGVIVLGIQRRARVVRRRLGRIRLEPGDTLLVAGSPASIELVRDNPDVVLLSGSKKELPVPKKAPLAAAIFLGVIGCAAGGLISIPVAAVTGAVAMIATNCLNIRQATRSIDRKIFLLVGSMLAIGTALQASDGAQFIANSLLSLPIPGGDIATLALLFILVAITTNILSNNACAVLFTPIALNMAANMGIDPMIFAITVIFAANCSFASPIGYQTNLLVMGPGHYKFRDFLISGVPLVIILWVTYIFIAKFYFGV